MNLQKYAYQCCPTHSCWTKDGPETLKMHEVVNLIMVAYRGNSVKLFLNDMYENCKSNDNEKQKALCAFAYYYVASKFDEGFVELVQKAWNDMVKCYSKSIS